MDIKTRMLGLSKKLSYIVDEIVIFEYNPGNFQNVKTVSGLTHTLEKVL